ncbi:hypothetical protein ANANG_G00035960 [Anguilla anguilla]|uniref:Caskin C-terminal domain-containing protein n=1 Tax=Anguilla anguilla TaxID=7936 RepID=A0A9D3S3N2_ANGAN|nr:hypothetical protein ANANG_G00035960 [Anguilla anguilla]
MSNNYGGCQEGLAMRSAAAAAMSASQESIGTRSRGSGHSQEPPLASAAPHSRSQESLGSADSGGRSGGSPAKERNIPEGWDQRQAQPSKLALLQQSPAGLTPPHTPSKAGFSYPAVPAKPKANTSPVLPYHAAPQGSPAHKAFSYLHPHCGSPLAKPLPSAHGLPINGEALRPKKRTQSLTRHALSDGEPDEDEAPHRALGLPGVLRHPHPPPGRSQLARPQTAARNVGRSQSFAIRARRERPAPPPPKRLSSVSSSGGGAARARPAVRGRGGDGERGQQQLQRVHPLRRGGQPHHQAAAQGRGPPRPEPAPAPRTPELPEFNLKESDTVKRRHKPKESASPTEEGRRAPPPPRPPPTPPAQEGSGRDFQSDEDVGLRIAEMERSLQCLEKGGSPAKPQKPPVSPKPASPQKPATAARPLLYPSAPAAAGGASVNVTVMQSVAFTAPSLGCPLSPAAPALCQAARPGKAQACVPGPEPGPGCVLVHKRLEQTSTSLEAALKAVERKLILEDTTDGGTNTVKSAGNILDDIGNMFDDLADQLDAMLD